MSVFSRKPAQHPNARRQWGAEKRTHPLPALHDRPSTRKIALSRLAIVLTIVFWVLYVVYALIRQFFQGPKSFGFTLEAVCYLFVVSFLTLSALMYLMARQGALQRFSKHVRVPRAELDRFFATNHPSITVLVPSYSEEPDVIRKTLLSAALQEYAALKVVLLIDDNPKPSSDDAAARLSTTRGLADEITQKLAEPHMHFVAAFNSFKRKYSKVDQLPVEAAEVLSREYSLAADWLYKMAANEHVEDHVDKFFVEQVIEALANELSLVSEALKTSYEEEASLSFERLSQLYQRLSRVFDAKVEVFERKKYQSLSHEANKAMNLNSYIGLMGGVYKQEQIPNGQILVPVKKGTSGSIEYKDSDFLLTLDADSILLKEYCLRLVYFLCQPDNARVAVTQTPYSSFRGSKTRIERLAGATTDVQHILHQGMSYYDATFWVGANAVIRKKALDDIAETEYIGGFKIRRYIQDRTVIEDTESSIDLSLHGWKLVNYPERLSYSATPPDFGSLIVQRRRWANGGLLILPKLWKQTKERKSRGEMVSLSEVVLRLNYMASITWASIGLVFLLAFPYYSQLLSPFVLLTALPYFLAMASDLKYCGYKRSDVFRIYGFNIILLPVNLAGVLKSLQQALSGKKIPFARTPKVKNRTLAQPLYIITPLLIIGFSLFTLWRDYRAHNWGNAAYAAFNAIVASWAIIACIGIWHAIVDLWNGYVNWLMIEVDPKDQESPHQLHPQLDWQAVLYHGNAQERVPLGAIHGASAATSQKGE